MGTTMNGFGSTYTIPIQSTLDIAIYAVFLTVVTVPVTVLVNRYVPPPHLCPHLTGVNDALTQSTSQCNNNPP